MTTSKWPHRLGVIVCRQPAADRRERNMKIITVLLLTVAVCYSTVIGPCYPFIPTTAVPIDTLTLFCGAMQCRCMSHLDPRSISFGIMLPPLEVSSLGVTGQYTHACMLSCVCFVADHDLTAKSQHQNELDFSIWCTPPRWRIHGSAI